jgi:hypothetical protein
VHPARLKSRTGLRVEYNRVTAGFSETISAGDTALHMPCHHQSCGNKQCYAHMDNGSTEQLQLDA